MTDLKLSRRQHNQRVFRRTVGVQEGQVPSKPRVWNHNQVVLELVGLEGDEWGFGAKRE